MREPDHIDKQQTAREDLLAAIEAGVRARDQIRSVEPSVQEWSLAVKDGPRLAVANLSARIDGVADEVVKSDILKPILMSFPDGADGNAERDKVWERVQAVCDIDSAVHEWLASGSNFPHNAEVLGKVQEYAHLRLKAVLISKRSSLDMRYPIVGLGSSHDGILDARAA